MILINFEGEEVVISVMYLVCCNFLLILGIVFDGVVGVVRIWVGN